MDSQNTIKSQIELLTISYFNESSADSFDSLELSNTISKEGYKQGTILFPDMLHMDVREKPELDVPSNLLKRTSTIVQHINVYFGVKDILYTLLWIGCG